MKQFRRGFILGKFYPPHNGHHYLIRHAEKLCDEVVVMILAHPQESISKWDRWAWLKIEHPHVNLLPIDCDLEVDYASEEAWQNHMGLIYTNMPPGPPVDAVFTSEDYGEELARRFGDTVHVKLDLRRDLYPISGTAVRANAPANWEHLANATRRGLSARVVILGAESTGSTTLAKALADYYKCPWVPEYGRMFSEGVGRDHVWSSADLVHIADQQTIMEEHMASISPLLICDTDVLATSIWHEFLVGGINQKILDLATPKTLYLLTDPMDTEWVDDGTRFSESLRDKMHQRFYDVLDARNEEFFVMWGTHKDRMEAATLLIGEALKEHWAFNDPVTEPTIILSEES